MKRQSPFHVLLIASAVLVGWLLAAKFVAAPMLAGAYRGESFRFLNEMISGQDVHPLEFYLDDWNRVARNVAMVIVGLGVCAFILLHPSFQRVVDAKWPLREFDSHNVKPMVPRRVWLSNLMIAFLAVFSGYAIAKPVELWPFSPYPMYAEIARGNTVEYLRLYGVTDSNDKSEVPLIEENYIYPFDDGKFNDMIQILLREKNQRRIVNVLRDTLARYEQRRQAGEHDGVPLTAMKVYRVKWTLETWATNRDRPDEKKLIAEVQR